MVLRFLFCKITDKVRLLFLYSLFLVFMFISFISFLLTLFILAVYFKESFRDGPFSLYEMSDYCTMNLIQESLLS